MFLVSEYLKKSEENKTKNDKEVRKTEFTKTLFISIFFLMIFLSMLAEFKQRLDSYYKRNYKDYFEFVEGSTKGKTEAELSESEKRILEWLKANK